MRPIYRGVLPHGSPRGAVNDEWMIPWPGLRVPSVFWVESYRVNIPFWVLCTLMGLPGMLRFSLLTLCAKGVTVWSRKRIGFAGVGAVTGIAAALVGLWATAAPGAPATAAPPAAAPVTAARAAAKVQVEVHDAAAVTATSAVAAGPIVALGDSYTA